MLRYPDVMRIRWIELQRALALRAEQMKQGVELYPTIMPTLPPWAEKLEVPAPHPIQAAPV